MNEDDKSKIEKGRMQTRTAAFLMLLLTLCSSVYVPGVLDGDSKKLIIGGLLSAFSMIIVFYFKKSEE